MVSVLPSTNLTQVFLRQIAVVINMSGFSSNLVVLGMSWPVERCGSVCFSGGLHLKRYCCWVDVLHVFQAHQVFIVISTPLFLSKHSNVFCKLLPKFLWQLAHEGWRWSLVLIPDDSLLTELRSPSFILFSSEAERKFSEASTCKVMSLFGRVMSEFEKLFHF